jgi:hypothetical protein
MQLELKSEFIPSEKEKQQQFMQELYIFIPNSLDINPLTYSKEDFYQDKVNLIRFKTPVFSLEELNNLQNTSSPFFSLKRLFAESTPNKDLIIDELKLLATAFHSALREQAHALYEAWRRGEEKAFDYAKIIEINSKQVFLHLNSIKEQNLQECKKEFLYVEEYMRNSLVFFVTGLLDEAQKEKFACDPEIVKTLQEICIEGKEELKKLRIEPEDLQEGSKEQEYFLYRQSLLNKFIFSSLFLSLQRKHYHTHLQNIVGSIAAAFAMLVFFILYLWQGTVFVLNSEPFILATVVLYVLKDRLKETIRTVFFQKAARLFPDQKTIITSPKTKKVMGKMTEGYLQLPLSSLPKEILSMRNEKFHDILEDIRRPETVLHYKKSVFLQNTHGVQKRRNCLNIIFRYNVEKLLRKADNPFHNYLTFDPSTCNLRSITLPKVYHLNIIMKNSTKTKEEGLKVQYKKFRVVVNKKGICRIEQLRN